MAVNHLGYRIIRPSEGGSFMQTDMVVLYMLDGEMSVSCYGSDTKMHKDDILLINSGTEYEIGGINEAVYASANYSIGVISQVMDKKSLLLYVNSAGDPLHSYQDLRDILQEMTAEYILHTHQTRAAIDSLMFRLLDCLIENYQLSQGKIEADANNTDARMRQMMQYIINHIQDEINLSDLAAEMFVSTSTLSRMFKKSTGMYFADYVMRLRVRTSLQLLRSSEQNLTQIAMNCGFATSAAFNRSFKKVTGLMPSEYRKKVQDESRERQDEERSEQEIREELRKRGYQFNSQDHRQEVELNLNELIPSFFKPVWNQCINFGSFYELSRANTQFHVLHLKEHLHFRYVRMWNVFSEKLMVSDGKTPGHYNFDLINQVLDFMVGHDLKPFIDLGRRPDTAIRSHGDEVYYHEEYIAFESRALWEDLTSAFLDEIISRYGMEEVSTWIFELTCDFHQRECQVYSDEGYDFFEVWKFTHRKIQEKIPGALFGGISSVVENDREFAVSFFRRCAKEQYVPDFVSFFLYSYELMNCRDADGSRGMKSVSAAMETDAVLQMKQMMRETGLEGCRLFLTEWNNSIGNRNFLNDSCFRAAYIISKIIDLWGESDLMAIMAGTDWVSSYIDTNRILHGGIGLLTKDTIGKPAFYALSFLEHMGTQLLAKGRHYILTKKGNGDLYLLCHNFSWFRQNTFVNCEDIGLDKIRQIRYEDERVLELKFTLRGLPEEGEYTIKKRSLNRHSGSVLDEWSKLNYEARLNREDVKYLQAISVPRIEMERAMTSFKRSMEVDVKMEPQEVVLLHIYKVH